MHIAKRPGQTLLEAIVAIGVILAAVIGSSTLIISSITAGRISQNRVEAANFAREGVEIVRSLRDGNWLKFQQNQYITPGDPSSLPAWNYSIGSPAINVPVSRNLQFNLGSTNLWRLQPCGACSGVPLTIYRVTYDDTGNGITRHWFSQYPSAASCNSSGRTCVATKYSRLLTITLIGNGHVRAEDVNGDGDLTDAEDVYLLVESTVTWPDRTGPKSLTAQTRLYDWK